MLSHIGTVVGMVQDKGTW